MRRRSAAVIVAAAVAVAAGVRLYHLDHRTITHPEVFAPGIPLPSFMAVPQPRTNVHDVLSGTFNQDVHPPGYYLAELGWTSLAGTTLFALRLPSVLVGTASVLLLYLFARRNADPVAALVAAWLLALHGQHVFYSQQARMWAPLAFLAVASALLLDKLQDRPDRATAAAYALTAAAGLWTEYYFWPFFAAQVVWAALRAMEDRSNVRLLDTQAVAFVLATPIFLYLRATQAWNYLRSDPTESLKLLAFANAVDLPALASLSAGARQILTGATIALAAALIAAGTIASGRKAPTHAPDREVTPIPFATLLTAAAAACAFIVLVLGSFASVKLTAVVAATPWLASLTWIVARRMWLSTSFPRTGQAAKLIRVLSADLPRLLVAVPLLALAAIHVSYKPVLAARALVIFAPFISLLIARGAMRIRGGVPRAAILAVLLTVSAAGTYDGLIRNTAPSDYRALAVQLEPLLDRDDVVLVENAWWTTPIYFYLPADRYRLMPPDALPAPLPRRAWVVNFGDDAADRIATAAGRVLPGYQERKRLFAREAQASLFEPVYSAHGLAAR